MCSKTEVHVAIPFSISVTSLKVWFRDCAPEVKTVAASSVWWQNLLNQTKYMRSGQEDDLIL